MDLTLPMALAIGIPLLLAAGALFLNACLVLRRARPDAADAADAALEALATESRDELVLELQRSVDEIKGQLQRQRGALAGFLSDAPEQPSQPNVLQALTVPPSPAAVRPSGAADVAAEAGGELRASVDRLVAEGLSDRAIARHMRIGLEEVRLARQRMGRAS